MWPPRCHAEISSAFSFPGTVSGAFDWPPYLISGQHLRNRLSISHLHMDSEQKLRGFSLQSLDCRCPRFIYQDDRDERLWWKHVWWRRYSIRKAFQIRMSEVIFLPIFSVAIERDSVYCVDCAYVAQLFQIVAEGQLAC